MGGAWAQTPPSKGDGSADKPYKISTAAELAWFRDQVNSGNNRVSATLTEDIDLAEFCHAADGTTYTDELSWTPITWFQGTYDGNGKTISNLYINAHLIIPDSSAMHMLAVSRISLSTMRG